MNEAKLQLDDRTRDNWALLFRIADLAGSEWPYRARCAAASVSAPSAETKLSKGASLLEDARRVFDAIGGEKLASTALARELARLEDPTGDYTAGQPLTPRGVAQILKPYGIKPRKEREANAYYRADFEDAWKRYLK